MTDQFLTIADAASRLRITERHLDHLIKADTGPRVTVVEGEQHVQIDDLVTWITAQEKPIGDVQSTVSTREFVAERFLTIREAAEQAGMSPHVLERRLKKKLGPAVEQYRGCPSFVPIIWRRGWRRSSASVRPRTMTLIQLGVKARGVQLQ